MQVTAIAKSIHMSPRKVGVVTALVRGRSAVDALTILDHTPRLAAKPVKKLIESVIANAENNHSLKRKDLTIVHLEVGGGPSMKRSRPAAHGRALPFKRRTSHVKIVVESPEVEKKPEATKKPAAKAKPASAATKTVKTTKKTTAKETK